MTIYTPIFEREGNRLLIPYDSFQAEDETTARTIAIGAFVEIILYGLTYTKEIQKIENKKIPHVAAKLGPMTVLCISGPLFEEAKANSEVPV